MKHIVKQPCNQSVAETRRRIRFLQRNILQLVSQPRVRRRVLLTNLYASLHAAREELRQLQSRTGQGPRRVA